MRLLTRLRRDEQLVCQQIVELVTDYLDGAMTKRDARRFEGHLTACDACTDYIEQFRTTVRSLGEMPEPPVDRHVREVLIGAFRDLRG